LLQETNTGARVAMLLVIALENVARGLDVDEPHGFTYTPAGDVSQIDIVELERRLPPSLPRQLVLQSSCVLEMSSTVASHN